MANEWFYTQQGKAATAPVSAAQLKQLATGGQLQPADLVWQEGMAAWVPASSMKGLFSSKASSAEQPVLDPTSSKMKPAEQPEKPAAGTGLLGWNPLVVFLLSALTLGVFGFVYIYKVCARFAAASNKRDTDKAGRTLGRARHPVGVLILAYLTFGYSFYIWLARAIKECQTYTGRRDFNTRIELSLMLIFPPYAIYVAVFRLPDLIKRTQEAAGVPEAATLQVAPLFVNPLLYLALPILGMIYQDALNQTWLNAA